VNVNFSASCQDCLLSVFVVCFLLCYSISLIVRFEELASWSLAPFLLIDITRMMCCFMGVVGLKF
jgi:hypothetical protein